MIEAFTSKSGGGGEPDGSAEALSSLGEPGALWRDGGSDGRSDSRNGSKPGNGLGLGLAATPPRTSASSSSSSSSPSPRHPNTHINNTNTNTNNAHKGHIDVPWVPPGKESGYKDSLPSSPVAARTAASATPSRFEQVTDTASGFVTMVFGTRNNSSSSSSSSSSSQARDSTSAGGDAGQATDPPASHRVGTPNPTRLRAKSDVSDSADSGFGEPGSGNPPSDRTPQAQSNPNYSFFGFFFSCIAYVMTGSGGELYTGAGGGTATTTAADEDESQGEESESDGDSEPEPGPEPAK